MSAKDQTQQQQQHGGSSSYSSSAGTGTSSMETLGTQDVIDGDHYEEEPEAEPIWGRLFPVGLAFTSLDLIQEEYRFGRDSKADYSFDSPAIKKSMYFQAYSKNHFRIFREKVSDSCYNVFLEDTSSNGTFLNGDKVGKHKKQLLRNNDEIALAMKKNKAFVFMDMNANEDMSLPEELRRKYTLSRFLGKGACGEVRLAFTKGTCHKFAVKIVSKKVFTIGGRNQRALDPERIFGEVQIMKGLKHPCIIKIEDVIDTEDTLYIVLELVEGGELFDRVVSLGRFTEPVAKLLFYQMLVAVKYLHEQGITHRDLKPENVLLGSDEMETIIKVTDFGLSKFVGENSLMKTLCGTPSYLAPEVLRTAGMGGYTKAVDCWSLGVILFVCLGGYPPFTDERKDMKLEEQIIRGSYQLHEKYWRGISDDAKDLIKKLLTVDPKKRFTVTQALNHPWLKDPEMTAKANKLMFPAAAGMPPPLSAASRKRPHPGQEESHNPNAAAPPTPPPPKRQAGDESSSSGSGSSTSTSAMSEDSTALSHTGLSDGVQEMIMGKK
ncbi:serine/threonine-protein kinase Chk2-like isoform X1 [Branchiostoma floridae x Branchiostoma japonicum]